MSSVFESVTTKSKKCKISIVPKKMDNAGENILNNHDEVKNSHWDSEKIEGCTIDGNRLRQINDETGYAYSTISMRAVDRNDPPPYKIQFAWSIQILNSKFESYPYHREKRMEISIGIATWPALSKVSFLNTR